MRRPAEFPPGRLLAVGLALTVIAGGCRGTDRGPALVPSPLAVGHQLYAGGDYAGAIRAYEAHLAASPEGEDADRVLYRLAIIRLAPESPFEDWNAARGLLERLVDGFPDSPYRRQAEVVLRLQQEVERLFRQLEEMKQLDLERSRRRPVGR